MINLFLVLLVAGGLTLFAFQNLTPIPLVILGQPTVALPLAIWILVAIAAGVATALLIAGLYKASNSVASRRATPRRPSARKSVFVGRFANEERSSSEPIRDSYRATAPQAEAPRRSAPPEDDWESDGTSDSWDDWDACEEPYEPPYEEPRDRPRPSAAPPRSDRTSARVPNPDPPLYDAEYRTLDPYGASSDAVDDVPYEPPAEPYRPYEPEPTYRSSSPQDGPPRSVILDDDDDDGPEEWEDWEGYDESSAAPRSEQPSTPYTGPIDFEVKQEPKTAYRSGTVYSYSYRDAAEDSGLGKEESVYRSSQPIITPPPASDQSDGGPSPSAESSDDEDWGLDDDFDAPRRRS